MLSLIRSFRAKERNVLPPVAGTRHPIEADFLQVRSASEKRKSHRRNQPMGVEGGVGQGQC